MNNKISFCKMLEKLKIAGEKLEKVAKFFWKKLEESQNKNEKNAGKSCVTTLCW